MKNSEKEKTSGKPANRRSIFLLELILLVIADQLSKIIIFNNNIFLDLKIFAISLVRNTGASFGILHDANSHLIWVSIIVMGILMMHHDKFPKKSSAFILLLISGLIGNLIDRIFRGFVIDFIDFRFWPVFNLADAMICIGVAGIVILALVDEYKAAKSKSSISNAKKKQD